MSLLERLCRTPDDRWPIVPRILAGGVLLFFGIKHAIDPEHFRQILTHAGAPFVDFNIITATTLEIMGGLMLLLGFVARLGALFGVLTMLPAILTTILFAGDLNAPAIPPWPVPVVTLLASLLVMNASAGRYSVDYAILPVPPTWPSDPWKPLPADAPQVPHVIIVGGGFGGIRAAQSLRFAPVRVTLIDRRNFHLFQPLLYQVATGALSPANIAAPLRGVLRKQRNTRVLLGKVEDIDVPNREVVLSDGRMKYDYLIVAAGARHAYFGRPEWEKLAPGLKSVEDATEIRRRVLWAFEMAERSEDREMCVCWQTFVVVGGGPTGVETAGAIAELAHHTLLDNFRHIDPTKTRVILVQSGSRVLPSFPENLSARAAADLARMGVEVRVNARVVDIQEHMVTIQSGETKEQLPASTVIWAAGVQASPLGAILGKATGAQVDSSGRVEVGPDLTLPGRPEIFVVGDLASSNANNGKPVPGVAPAAMQMGEYAARQIMARLNGRALPPWQYYDKGSMATIGRAAAVVDAKGIHLTGLPAWLAWLFVHLMFLVSFESRILVLWQWFWNYVTRNRSARLITGQQWQIGIGSFEKGVKEVVPAEKLLMMNQKPAAPAEQKV